MLMSSYLLGFKYRPEAWENCCIVFKTNGICSLFLRKTVVSSASWLMIHLWLCMSNPSMFEFLTVIASSCVTATNRRGETLHPCLLPCSTLNLGHVPSVRETQLLISVCSIVIISRKVFPKPKCLSVLTINACSTKSNALWKSKKT